MRECHTGGIGTGVRSGGGTEKVTGRERGKKGKRERVGGQESERGNGRKGKCEKERGRVGEREREREFGWLKLIFTHERRRIFAASQHC